MKLIVRGDIDNLWDEKEKEIVKKAGFISKGVYNIVVVKNELKVSY
jgi:hypothetical protein